MSDKTQETDWEGEGGALASEPKQKTPKGLEIPLPKRSKIMDAFAKVARPKPKKG